MPAFLPIGIRFGIFTRQLIAKARPMKQGMKPSPCDWHVRDLTDSDLKRWLEIGPYLKDRRRQINLLRNNLAFDGLKQPFRLMAMNAKDQLLAKLGGYTTSTGRLTFWPLIHFRTGLSLKERRQATRLLIEACIVRAKADRNIRYIETMLSLDTPARRSFQTLLGALGFKLISRAHVYTKKLKQEELPDLSRSLPDLRLTPAITMPVRRLEQLLKACQSGTLDPAQRDAHLTGHANLKELRHYAGKTAASDFWSIACWGDKPVGFAFSGPVPDPEDKPGYAYLIELGVLPEFRARGIGSFLVRSMMGKLSRRGMTVLQSFLDDENVPSCKLHKHLGFIRKPGPHWTWRNHVRA